MQEEKDQELWAKFQELLFLSNADTLELKLVILIHSINLSNDLICNGLLEDDVIENYIIPSNWSKHIDNVYSFRYTTVKQSDEQFYFKIIHEPEADLIYINALTSKKSQNIISFEIAQISKLNLNEKNASLTKLIKGYKDNILKPLLEKQDAKKAESSKIITRVNEDFFWTRPRNNEQTPSFVPNFGDYGSSDLRPIPLGGGINSGGSLLGPNNPIFMGGPTNQNPSNSNPFYPGPNIRFDPFGPDGFNGTFPQFDQGRRPSNPNGGGKFGGYNYF